MHGHPLLLRAILAAEASQRLRADYAQIRRASLSARIATIGRVVAVMELVATARKLCERTGGS